MSLPKLAYGFQAAVPVPYPEAVALAREALAAAGFGAVAEIDVQATLRGKLGVDRRPYLIIGACNPALAHQALAEEPAIGLLLPCNVVVRESDDPGTSVVAVLDPVAQLGITGREDLRPVAEKVRTLMLGVLEDVGRRAAPTAPKTKQDVRGSDGRQREGRDR